MGVGYCMQQQQKQGETMDINWKQGLHRGAFCPPPSFCHLDSGIPYFSGPRDRNQT
jgi:hypothetical protein